MTSIYDRQSGGGILGSLVVLPVTLITLALGAVILTLLAGAFPYFGAVLFGLLFLGMAFFIPQLVIFSGRGGWNITLNFVLLSIGLLSLFIGFFGSNIQNFLTTFFGVIPPQLGVIEGVKTTIIQQSGGVAMPFIEFIVVIAGTIVVMSYFFDRFSKKKRRK